LANQEQDQASGTGPAGIEAHDTEDEGTFRWPSTGLPKLFGQQSAEADELPPAGEPAAGPATEHGPASSAAGPETQHRIPYQYRASFGGATFVHLVAPSPPDPDEAGGAEQTQGPVLAGEPAGAQEPARMAEPAEVVEPAGAPEPARMAEPAEVVEPARVAEPAQAQGQAGLSPAEAVSPAQIYGVPAAYGHEEYDPPDDYPMAEYHTGAPAGQALEPVPPPREAPPPWQHAETADSLTADLLLPARHTAPPSGWRRAIYQATGGRLRPPLSATEVRRRELVARACTPVSGGHHRVAVLSLKGGVGKTTTVMGLGSTLASLRGDRVIAVDANPDRGTLSDKLRLETAATVRDLLNERGQMQRYADVRAFTSQAPSRLEVLASDRDPTVSVAFSDQDYEDVSQVLEHYYSICLTDCGTGLLHSAMAAVLRLADQIVLVSSPSVDGARSASATLDWLQAHGYSDLVTDAVVVLSVIRPRSKSAVDLGRLEQHFATRCRAVVRIPYDAHLEEGAEVDLGLLSKATADAYLALAAEVGDGFSWPHRAPAAAGT
jgi:MinD-like ATPase involved in chromosome partitioning or flagellar assembly